MSDDDNDDESTVSQEMIVLEDDTVVLPDGIYEFEVRYGSAFVYELEQQTELVQVEAGHLADGDYGTVLVQNGVPGPLEVVGNSQVEQLDEEPSAWQGNASYEAGGSDEQVAAAPEQAAEVDKWATWRTWPDHFDAKLDAAQFTSGQAVRDLVEAEDSSARVPFIATSNYALLGEVDEEIATYFAPVAVRGQVRFTRNRTRPNAFTVENVAAAYPDADFPTWFTGTGDDRALARLVVVLKWIVEQPSWYRHRDASRIRIDGV